MGGAAANGHLEVVQWLHTNRFEGCTTRAMDDAAAGGHLNVLQWLYGNRVEGYSDGVLDRALAGGHLRVVHWLLVNGVDLLPGALRTAYSKGNSFETLLFMHWHDSASFFSYDNHDAISLWGSSNPTLDWLVKQFKENERR
ncbi:hypothetical protein BBJ28_00018182 [Nothophytophthora sp. Chile5]|nr:hypothetical protein BBJ28_00018182 [Nothophytophthora sp. Chile5]